VNLPPDSPRGPESATPGRRAWQIILLAALPIAAALYLGILAGVFAEKIAAGITALILGLPLAVAAGLIVGRVSSQSATAIRETTGLLRVREAVATFDLRTDPEQPERIEILHPALDPDGSASDTAMINLARRLAERGRRPRLILLDDNHPERGWRERLARNPEIGTAIRELEVATPAAGGDPPVLNPEDQVIATDWRSAHTADRVCLELNRSRFTYLILEYQPFQYPMGSFAALADASYELPHRAIFLDGLLREYFSDQRLGVFAAGPKLGLRETATLKEPIPPVPVRTEAELAGSDRRRLLIYSRPEEDGSGNLYELAIMALDRAVLDGHFRSWDLAAFGETGGDSSIVLPRSSARMRLLNPEDAATRSRLLAGFDVGMALRYAPGLGPVPVEMATAGMSVVTTTFADKDEAALAAVSANLIAAEPRLGSIVTALATAEHRTADHEGRLAAARIGRPASWDEALDDQAMAAIEDLLART